MPNKLKWLGYLALAAALPLAVLGATLPPNEFAAQGIDALDCDGLLQVMVFAMPAVAVFGAGAVINWIGPRRPARRVIAALCLLACLPVAVNAGSAIAEARHSGDQCAAAARP